MGFGLGKRLKDKHKATGKEDDDRILCRHCGFPCNPDIHLLGDGESITRSVTAGVPDIVVNEGCPNCGSTDYK